MQKRRSVSLRLKNNVDYYLTAIVTVVFYFLLVCKENTYPFYPDQMGTLATAAKMSGHIWADAIASSRYYGFGYYFLYHLIFRYTNDPHLFMWIHYSFVTILVLLSNLIVCKISKELFRMNIGHVIALLPLIFSNVCAFNTFQILNAPIEYCSFWVCVLCIKRAYFSKKRAEKNMYSILCAVMMVYIMLLHETASAIFISFSVSLIIFWLVFREWMVQPLIWGGTAALGGMLGRILRNYVIEIVWNKQNASSLDNTSAFQHISAWFLNGPAEFKVFVDVLISNLTYLNENTFGLFSIAICFTIFIIYKTLKEDRNELSSDEKFCFGISIFTIGIALIIIIGLGTSWGRRAFEAYVGNSDLGTAYRGFGYGRYYLPFFSPAILVALVYIDKAKNKKMIIKYAFLLTICLAGYYLKYVHPYLWKQWGQDRLGVFTIFNNSYRGMNIIISLLIPIGILIIIKKSKSLRPVILSMLFVCVVSAFSSQIFQWPNINDQSYCYYEFQEELKSEGYDIEKAFTTSDMLCRLQFQVQDVELQNIDKWNQEEKAFLFLKKEDEKLLAEMKIDNIQRVNLSENLAIYYQEEFYSEIIEEMGYSIETIIF